MGSSIENELQSQSFEADIRSYIPRKRNKPHHPNIIFNVDQVKKSSYQKHLGMFLDSKLDFDEHIKGVFDNTSKSIGLIRKLRNFVLRSFLLQIYKSFVRPHLEYVT